MHEISLVRQMLRSLEDRFSEDQLTRLTGIRLCVGQLSNIEPSSMESAFEAVKKDIGKFHEVWLSLEVAPVMVSCDSCGELSPVRDMKFRCAACDNPATRVVSGFDVEIRQLEFVDD